MGLRRQIDDFIGESERKENYKKQHITKMEKYRKVNERIQKINEYNTAVLYEYVRSDLQS